MKKFKAAIFDMDGTLLDSMQIWRHLAARYLQRNNIALPEGVKLKTMGLETAADFLIENFHLKTPKEEIIREFFEILEEYYRYEAGLKPGAVEFLQKLQERKIKTVLFSATPENMLHLVMNRLDMTKYFTHGLLSCRTIKHNKYEEEAFFIAAKHLETAPEDIIIFEDAWYAASTAKRAGFTLGIIADDIEPRTAEMKELADFYVEKHWDEFPIDRFF